MRHRGWWLTITGTGYCGTGYLSRVLSSVDVRCTHEGVFTPGDDNAILDRIHLRQRNAWWGWQADSSWLAVPFLSLPEMDNMTVVHLVRDPKKVIDSMVRNNCFELVPYRDFQFRKLPELTADMDVWNRVALFCVRWSQLIEPHATLRWRVEDDVLGLLDQLQISYQGKCLDIDTTYNHHHGWGIESDVKLADINDPLRTELLEMSTRYGYEWRD